MTQILNLLMIGLITLTVNGLKLNDFCNMMDKECVGQYDFNYKYSVVCTLKTCAMPYTLACGRDKCARSEMQCENYLNINRFFSSISFKDILLNMNPTQKTDMVKMANQFKSFKRNIQNCKTTTVYEWNPESVCLRGYSCYQKTPSKTTFDLITMFSLKDYEFTRRMCPCMSLYLNYECKVDDSYYCTKTQTHCEYFIQKFDLLKASVKRECDNDVNIMM